MITNVDDRFGMAWMKAGPEGNGTGSNGFIVRRSYTFTSGSGNGRHCLEESYDEEDSR